MHVRTIGEKVPEYLGTTLWGQAARWGAYQFAAGILTHDVHVAPDWERAFERMAAPALLLSKEERVSAMP
jgi:hypothetical protein